MVPVELVRRLNEAFATNERKPDSVYSPADRAMWHVVVEHLRGDGYGQAADFLTAWTALGGKSD